MYGSISGFLLSIPGLDATSVDGNYIVWYKSVWLFFGALGKKR